MVERAERIAVVDVVSVQAAWNARHERITTAVQLQIVESWKGGLQPGTQLTVLQPGGTVGDVTTTVDGMPRFTPGERTLVFLHGPTDRATVVGLTQGKRPLRRDPTSGRWLVRARIGPVRISFDCAPRRRPPRPRSIRASGRSRSCARRSSPWLPRNEDAVRGPVARDFRDGDRVATSGGRLRPLLHRAERAVLLGAAHGADHRLHPRLQSADHDDG